MPPNISLLASSLFLLLLTPSTSATCAQFTQQGQVYVPSSLSNTSQYVYEQSQQQTVSAGFVCTTNSTTYGNATTTDPATNATVDLCTISATGTIRAKGSNNISLSDADAEQLYTLVNGTFTNKTNPYITNGGYNFSLSAEDCAAGPEPDITELYAGQAGYFRFTPLLTCVNGTLDACSAGGPVANGTAISLCGAVRYTQGSAKWGYGDYLAGSIHFINTTVAEAAALGSNPAGNATCAAFHGGTTTSGAKTVRGLGGLLVLSGFVMVGMLLG